MILVLGATGTTGGEVARQLIGGERRPRLLVRQAGKARAFEGKAEIVEGDLGDARRVDAALEGVEKLFLVTATHGGVDPELEVALIEAAKRKGVRHVVKLSVVGADAPVETFAKQHARAEAALRASGMAWTMVRPHYFMSNFLQWVGTIRSQGIVYYPTGEARWAAVDPADIGAVAVKALTEPGHEGRAYAVSGPESLSAATYVEKIAKAIGKPLRFVNVPLESVRDGLLKAGVPPTHAEPVMDLLLAMKNGKHDVLADGVEKATGRRPRTFDDWARRNAAAFS